MASNAAAPFWRAAGMTYITYSNICANLVRNCLKEPYKTEALSREKVQFAVTKFADGNPQKPKILYHGFDLLGPRLWSKAFQPLLIALPPLLHITLHSFHHYLLAKPALTCAYSDKIILVLCQQLFVRILGLHELRSSIL
ncbi:hypothetical protein DKX38_012046 [Salix brachista]|uniref:ATP synthase subunit epsilon, mitochondrial n=1 Tax=Salix brachista TaxID=2182728 RepID=A0A5N5LM92_9ROSI|nr:hypothetical protein DKX38_012046 [Salix brachista]